MPFIIFEWLYVCLAAGFIGLVVLGHALLFGAIYKCLREDWAIGQRADRKPRLQDGANKSIAARWFGASGRGHDLPGHSSGRKIPSNVILVTERG